MRQLKLIIAAFLLISPFAASADVIESFDDCDISDYSNAAAGSVGAAFAHDGACGLGVNQGGGPTSWLWRDDAAVNLAQGDTFSAWVLFDNVVGGRAYFGFGASAAGTLSFVLAPNTGDIIFQENPGYNNYINLNTSAQSFLVNSWYRAEVIWGIGGSLVGNLYGSDGITLLNSVSASSNLYTSGGIAFRGFSGFKAFDTIERVSVPEPGTLALLGIGLLGIGIARRRKI